VILNVPNLESAIANTKLARLNASLLRVQRPWVAPGRIGPHQFQISPLSPTTLIQSSIPLQNCFARVYFPSLLQTSPISRYHTFIDPHDAIVKMGRASARTVVQCLRRLLYPFQRRSSGDERSIADRTGSPPKPRPKPRPSPRRTPRPPTSSPRRARPTTSSTTTLCRSTRRPSSSTIRPPRRRPRRPRTLCLDTPTRTTPLRHNGSMPRPRPHR
jgi:hypothetical protein